MAETLDTIVVDPALDAATPTYPAAAPGTQRYFEADDGDLDYTIVARDLDHAKTILTASGVEVCGPDDDTKSTPIADAPWVEWTELSDDRAAAIRVRDDDNRGTSPNANGWPLNTYEPGDWFCSEW